jgi:hypothetical protein
MNRFDLEQEILSCWQVLEDLKTLSLGVMEYNMSTDKIVNVLSGLNDLYQIRFEKVFATFEAMLEDGQLASGFEDEDFDKEDEHWPADDEPADRWFDQQENHWTDEIRPAVSS